MRIHISQNNFKIGDLDYNFEIIKSEYKDSCNKDSNLIVFSELAVTGYPPQDLLRKEYFIKSAEEVLEKIVALTNCEDCAILIGSPISRNGKLYNAALLIKNGRIIKEFYKKELPNYELFDERRYFERGKIADCFVLDGLKISVLICEDVWANNNIEDIKAHRSDLLIVINASPFSTDKMAKRLEVCASGCRKLNSNLIYVNQVGGVDSMVFDGKSFAMNRKGELLELLSAFAQDSKAIYFDNNNEILSNKQVVRSDEMMDIYNALILAARDYVAKTGFAKVVVGMSGGIDSALVANILVDALSSENVRLIALPTRFNAKTSFDDANLCAKNLAVDLQTIAIEDIFNTTLDVLNPHFQGKSIDVTEQNMQSRIRGMVLMAISNKFNELLITTGNKSEMATGYATIYGDMNGAFNPIKDVYKSQVFALAKWRNENVPTLSVFRRKNLIPDSIIIKEPSAELAFEQKDSDSLPDYEVLDQILYKIVEEEKSVEQIIAQSELEESVIRNIAKLFYQNEYKRKQAVIGPKISKMAFDLDRRYLITNNFWK